VQLLLLGPSFFPIIIFLSTTLLTGTTGISLQVQWPLTSKSQTVQCFHIVEQHFADNLKKKLAKKIANH
jgi:hypothetical protein